MSALLAQWGGFQGGMGGQSKEGGSGQVGAHRPSLFLIVMMALLRLSSECFVGSVGEDLWGGAVRARKVGVGR